MRTESDFPLPMRLPAIAALAAAFLFSASNAAAAEKEKIDQFIKAEMQRQRIPGIALAVIKGGHLVVAKGYGFANVEHRVPVTRETVFQSGSMAKQFAAIAVMMLAEEGKLSLDDKLGRHFADAPETWQNISVRQLLNHTSGMTDYPDDFDLRRDHSEEEMLKIIYANPLAFRPGEQWSYSNLGYVTLGILVRRVTGKFYGDVLHERIFEPLGMSASGVISESDIVPNRAAGYRLVNGELKNQEWVSPSTNTTADGSLYLTIADMVKWDAALNSDKLLKRASLEQIWTPARLNNSTTYPYGFGWHLGELGPTRVQFHGGGWQGFKSFIVRLVDEKLTIVFFANMWNTNEQRLARGIVSIFHPELALPAARPIEDSEPAVAARIKRLLRQLSEGNADTAAFTSDAQLSFFPEAAKQMRERLNGLSLPVAIISCMDLIERKEADGMRFYRYLLTDLGRSLFLRVRIDQDNHIAAIELEPD